MPADLSGATIEDFIRTGRIAALATADDATGAVLSPKGDPAGSFAQLDVDTLWFADRPGNQRMDSFRNIVVRPPVGLALVVPGSNELVRIRGRAMLTTDQAARVRFAVADGIGDHTSRRQVRDRHTDGVGGVGL